MSVRTTLFYNAKAGFEEYSPEVLLKLLKKHGFDAHYVNPRGPALARALRHPGELIVIAGGDGTVGRLAKKLMGKKVPVGILPLGTANNIATSLHIAGKPKDIIARWDMALTHDFDVGTVTLGKEEKYFLESVGFGLFPRLIRQRKNVSAKRTREQELADALKHQLHILQRYQPHHCAIEMNGETLEGKYLMVEAMNTSLAGSSLRLAPLADSSDGLIDVVLVHENERERFADFLRDNLNGQGNSHCFPVHRTKKLKVTWQGKHYHCDDTTHRAALPITVKCGIVPSKLHFLTA